MIQENRKVEWEKSYSRGDNFVFHPHEEVIRFISKYVRKRIGINEFQDMSPFSQQAKLLDLGCGIGRHVKFCHEMGLDTYGIDLSSTAITTAHAWMVNSGLVDMDTISSRVIQGDIRQLPWEDGYFTYAISHGVLDSMSWDIARMSCLELARTMVPGGLFYCDLISGDDSNHAREFSGEEIITTKHEEDTIQLYFNMRLIQDLILDIFAIKECKLIRSEDVLSGKYYSRYHLTLIRT
jgi:SAM-dependent methyltransferase